MVSVGNSTAICKDYWGLHEKTRRLHILDLKLYLSREEGLVPAGLLELGKYLRRWKTAEEAKESSLIPLVDGENWRTGPDDFIDLTKV